MALLAQRDRDLSDDIARMRCGSGSQRVTDFLLKLCPVECGSAVISLPYGKGLIARQLGLRPESFSRLLAGLTSFGVKVIGNRVQISDVGALSPISTVGREGFSSVTM